MAKKILLIKTSTSIDIMSRLNGILQKGGALPPGSIRNWGGKEYVKFAPGDWRRKVENKGAKDSGDEAAKIMSIGKAEKWLVDSAKDVGIDIEGFEHEVTSHFVEHAMKRHSDEAKERENGQISLTSDDFAKLPSIVMHPDIAIVGAKRRGQNILAYTKKFSDGTSVFFEEVLDTKKRKALNGVTMYKRTGDLNEIKFKNIVGNRKGTDMSNAKIVAGAGGHPSVKTNT